MFSFYSDDSYEPIPEKLEKKEKTCDHKVPKLNLNCIPEYQTSSDQEDEANMDQEQLSKLKGGDMSAYAMTGQMDQNAYEQSMQYIEAFYSKCNIKQDEEENNSQI